MKKLMEKLIFSNGEEKEDNKSIMERDRGVILADEEKREDNQIIKEHEKWFKSIVKWPTVIAVLIGISFFFSGVQSCFYSNADEGVANMLVTWIAGGLISWAVYACMRLSIAYKVLHIYYLKKLQKQEKEKNE